MFDCNCGGETCKCAGGTKNVLGLLSERFFLTVHNIICYS